jgi:hypothetical protein
MRVRVTDPAGTNLPNGKYARPGDLIDSTASGIAGAVLDRLLAKGIVESVDAPKAERLTTLGKSNVTKGA